MKHKKHVVGCHETVPFLSCLMTKPTKWHVRQVKTQISLGICQVWSESSLSHKETLGPQLPIERTAKTESDQTRPGLIWVFAGRTFILLVLSWGGSFSCNVTCLHISCMLSCYSYIIMLIYTLMNDIIYIHVISSVVSIMYLGWVLTKGSKLATMADSLTTDTQAVQWNHMWHRKVLPGLPGGLYLKTCRPVPWPPTWLVGWFTVWIK